MSDVVLQPSTFVVPAGIVVPPNGQPDYAFEQVIPFKKNFSGTALSYTVPANYYDLVIAATTLFGADATAGSRAIVLSALDVNQTPIFNMPAPTAITAGGVSQFNWNFGLSFAYSIVGDHGEVFQAATLPPVLLSAGSTVDIFANNPPGSLDEFQLTSLTLIHIPTGPLPNTTEDLVATPLVL